VLCANAGYDPFTASNIAGFTKGGRPAPEDQQEEEITLPADTMKRQDAIKSYCTKRFVSKNPGATMVDRFMERTTGVH
jgi:hypothetical protein